MENEAHSQRARPRQRPRDLCWRWKLVENSDCLQGLSSRPQWRIDTTFTLRSTLETLFHKDNHCQTPFHLLQEPSSKIKCKGFLNEKYRAPENASGPSSCPPSSPRALPRASCVHTCNLLARTVTWLHPPARSDWSRQPAHPSPVSRWGTLWKSSLFVSVFIFSPHPPFS